MSNKNEMNWVSEINDMRTNQTRIQKGLKYADLQRSITGHFIFPTDDEGKLVCNCGERVTEKFIKTHLKSKKHNDWVKKILNQQSKKPHQYTDYVCTHGKYEGYKVEDIVYVDPNYIDFLIREYKHTFPAEFTKALKDCGLKW